jgi:hypothetical protein
MRTEPALHLSEDTTELYALRRLSLEELSSVEGHIITCADCQDAVIRAAAFAGIIRQALHQLTEELRPISTVCIRPFRFQATKYLFSSPSDNIH